MPLGSLSLSLSITFAFRLFVQHVASSREANCANEVATCNAAAACHEIKLQALGFAFNFHQICPAAFFVLPHTLTQTH